MPAKIPNNAIPTVVFPVFQLLKTYLAPKIPQSI